MTRVTVLRLGLIGLTIATFSRVPWMDFSGWDDAAVLAHNPHLRPPTIESLAAAWTGPRHHLYVPVTQTAWWSLAHVAQTDDPPWNRPGASGSDQFKGSLDPLPFHIASVTVHVVTVVITFALLRKLAHRATELGVTPPTCDIAAALGAAVFAVHPVQVEAVAWASGLKDLLAGAFGLAALAAYVRAVGGDRFRPASYALACALLVLATLSKPSAVVVPLMAWIVDRFILRRRLKQTLRAAGGLGLVVLPCVIWTRIFQPGLHESYPGIVGRLLIAGDVMTFYLGKVFWPVGLAFDYGRTPESVLASPAVYWSLVVLIIVAGVCLMIWRWFRWPGIAAMLFAAGLLPVLGVVPFDFQMYSTVGDHYLYLAMLGPAVLVTALPIWHRRAVVVAGGVLIAVLAAASYRQSLAWRSPETLSRQNLAVNPGSWASHNNLAMWLLEQGRPDEALVSADAALAHRPDDPLVHRTFVTIATHRAADLAEAGRLDEALRLYERAVEIAPENAAARRGIEMIRAGQATP